MKATPKELQYHLHDVLTTLLGSGYTMKPAKVEWMIFRKNGQQVWFLPRFLGYDLKWGTVIGYLLWARSNGWDEVDLFTPDVPIWLSVGQKLYNKDEETEIRRLLRFTKNFPYLSQTDASREASHELFIRFIKLRQEFSEHYVNIYTDVYKGVKKKFTGAPYPVYNYATVSLTDDAYHQMFAADNGITVERSRALEAQVKARLNKS
jgi:hypothetical protein